MKFDADTITSWRFSSSMITHYFPICHRILFDPSAPTFRYYTACPYPWKRCATSLAKPKVLAQPVFKTDGRHYFKFKDNQIII